jgi:hypothetical protein
LLRTGQSIHLSDPPAIAYRYAPGRGAVHALKLLDGYRGIVQCDGYAAYKTIADKASGEAITLAFCRVGEDVAIPAPHRPGRADFPHPVLHA